MAGWSLWSLFAVAVAAGCGCTGGDPDSAPRNDSQSVQSVGQPSPKYKRAFQAGESAMRPEYLPDKGKLVEYVDVGRVLTVGIGEALDGGAWRLESYEGGAVGFAGSSKKEFPNITLVYDNWTNKLVAVRAY